jgi:ABC-type sulfate transport system permease component
MEGSQRERPYKMAIVLSVAFVVDGALMAWALVRDGYALLGYGKLVFLPIFIPSFLVGLVVSGKYVYGFARHSWRARKAEWLFFFLFAGAIAAKVAIFIHRQCCG